LFFELPKDFKVSDINFSTLPLIPLVTCLKFYFAKIEGDKFVKELEETLKSKELNDFLVQHEGFLQKLSDRYHRPVTELWVNKKKNPFRGVWGHPTLLPKLGAWLSQEYAVVSSECFTRYILFVCSSKTPQNPRFEIEIQNKKLIQEKENTIGVLKFRLASEEQASEVLSKALTSTVNDAETLKGEALQGLLVDPNVLFDRVNKLQINAMQHTGPPLW